MATKQSLNKQYNSNKELGLKKRSGVFAAPLSSLYVEADYNVRELDFGHINGLTEAYKAERYVPAMVVRVTDKGLQVIDGHHRFPAATAAKLEMVSVEEFQGTEAEAIALMITSSQGRPLEPLEKANAYKRMLDEGLTKMEIHTTTGNSRSSIDKHLTLLDASPAVVKALKEKTVSMAAVTKELKGDVEAGNNSLEDAIKKATAKGLTVDSKTIADKKEKVVTKFTKANLEQLIKCIEQTRKSTDKENIERANKHIDILVGYYREDKPSK